MCKLKCYRNIAFQLIFYIITSDTTEIIKKQDPVLEKIINELEKTTNKNVNVLTKNI